jgi:hypothetical protein
MMIGEPKHTCGRVDGSCRRCTLCKRVRVVPTTSARLPSVRVCEHCDGAAVAGNIRRSAA